MPAPPKDKKIAELVEQFGLKKTYRKGQHLWGVSETNVIWYFTFRRQGSGWRTFAVPEEARPQSVRCPLRWLNDPTIPVTNAAWREKVRAAMKEIKTGAIAKLNDGSIVLITKKDSPRAALGPQGKIPIHRKDIESLTYDEWLPVESSNLAAVRYRGTNLDIQFKNTTVYRYSKVPPEVLIELLNAESIGSAFHRLIRSGPFEYEKL